MRKNPSSVSFREAAGGPERSEGGISRFLYFQSEIPRQVYPERNTEILRFAQNDKRPGNDTARGGFSESYQPSWPLPGVRPRFEHQGSVRPSFSARARSSRSRTSCGSGKGSVL